ncbi:MULTISPECIES: cystathionine beta-lyase [Parageobacillus]|jgi:cysteine-S-conjugate beta-lyase|uniref:cysteine-S-conjugate beta-lyase n=3 Tax=Parageobacillus toebii TaxID=153151 RepID=A0A6G9J2A0_9BACL|nr:MULTISPECIES: cystathionine beta-lyase [Parageobacillus]KYD23202.1 Cystathionine beta-lyase [Parageobacillus toebii]MBB3868187.1 cystathionine beta-lyase [Parageobacillus toebii NBRC 107807]MED4971380.1 cystathionine beta-lyase [Parageobacillus toebii]QIQ32858.1 cystathionine beta-lyase [Parageobacillus toebii NBRC 107807]WMT17677.1 cystathionine beta-lyase [Parageobacillus toebii]
MEQHVSFQTKLLHNKWKMDPQTGAVSVPIQHASTFHQFDFDTFGKYDYSRSGNPTREALEETIAALEGGVRGFAFSSGMAAISTAFLLLSKGDHVLVTEDVYGGTYRMITEVLSRFGIEYTFVDMTDLHEVASHIRPNTKVIYVETPSNPLLKVTDIRGIVKLAKANGCLTFLDNTFMTPALQRPLDLGVDVVLHSATKFLSGHSDVVAGLAVVKDEELAKQLYKLQNSFGAVLGVQDAWLVLRGLKTLHVRLEQSSQSALAIARYLANHPKVEEVYYPGLTYHPGHAIQRYQASGFGAVLSFRLADEEAVRTFVKHVRIPVFAVSLGAVESILSYPAKMSHAAMPKEERERRGITDGLLRLSVGLEAADDLIADFEQALSYVKETSSSTVSAR